MTPKITCIVTLHREGLTSHQTLRALQVAAEHARTNAVPTEIIVVLDRPDEVTKDFLTQKWPNLLVKEVDFGDPAQSRNYGVSIAEGAYIAICDGDDLFGKNWLLEAYKLSVARPKTIIHPEFNICFDRAKIMYKHLDQEEKDFIPSGLAFENYWTALSFSQKSTYLECPYRATDRMLGYGFEDWHWNCEAIAKNFIHKVAKGTVHFIRLKKHGSRNQMAASDCLVMPNTTFFSSDTFLRGNYAKVDKDSEIV